MFEGKVRVMICSSWPVLVTLGPIKTCATDPYPVKI